MFFLSIMPSFLPSTSVPFCAHLQTTCPWKPQSLTHFPGSPLGAWTHSANLLLLQKSASSGCPSHSSSCPNSQPQSKTKHKREANLETRWALWASFTEFTGMGGTHPPPMKACLRRSESTGRVRMCVCHCNRISEFPIVHSQVSVPIGASLCHLRHAQQVAQLTHRWFFPDRHG